MNNPRELLNRARRKRPSSAPPRPPVPAADPTQPSPTPEPAPVPPERRVAPQPIGGHALYRALMRSHDRMGTRHLDRRG